MSSTPQFVAQILETSAAGYAGLTASLLLERRPEIEKRYEPDGFSNWKAQLRQWLLDLSAAVDAGEPKLFETRMLWTRKSFLARQSSADDLQAALEALRDILRERLPEDSVDAAVSPVDRALEALADPQAADVGELDPGEPAGRSALSYLKTILEGKPREAIEQLLGGAADEASVKAAYLEVLLPAQREAGRMWHEGELSIAEEHVITATTQRAMALLCDRARPSSSKNKTALLACVAGNVHDVGIRAVSDFFEMAGWRAIYLGSDVPHDEVARGVPFFGADVVVLAATLDQHIRAVQRVIDRIRAVADRDVKIIVGGPRFRENPRSVAQGRRRRLRGQRRGRRAAGIPAHPVMKVVSEPPELLARVAKGDQGAVEECLDRFGNLVWSLARRFTASRADAEDAVQEIFIDLWSSAARYDSSKASETTFVAMVARRRLIDRLRRSQRHPDTEELSAVTDAHHAAPPPDAAVMDDAARATQLISKLKPEQQQVIKLAVYEGHTHQSIADVLQLPLGTVKTHLRRGLLKVREAMQDPVRDEGS